MRPAAALALGALALTACARGRVLRPDEPITLTTTEGLLAFAADTNGELTVVLCKDGGLVDCVSLGPVESTSPPVVTRVTEGRYCLMQLVFEHGGDAGILERVIEREDAQCFDVKRGALTYPGHYVFQTRPTQVALELVRVGWQKRESAMRAQLDAAYPNLSETPLDSVSVFPLIASAAD